MPVRLWRTGEPPAPTLPLAARAAAPAPPRIWIDTDAACGSADQTDADDCFALLLLVRTAARHIVGVSAAAGNAPPYAVERILRTFMAKAAANIPVHGAADAAAALADALQRGPLTIVALGPLSNVATMLRERPDLATRVTRIIAVMGRRSGHLFHPSEGRAHGMLFGHGPVFRDFNYAKDPSAAEQVMRSGVPIVLVPYEAARDVVLTASDLDALAASGGVQAWVASRASGWLGYWRKDVGLDGFYPFDLVAAAYVLQPGLFKCASVRWWIESGLRPSFFVGLEHEQPAAAHVSGTATYCPRVGEAMHDWLVRALLQ